MDTTKTNDTAQHKNRAGTRKNLLKFMFLLFVLHAIITFLSHGTGVVETFRSFLIHVFWPPEGWVGEPLPVHQQLVHATLTALWSLPFLESLLVAVRFSDAPTHGRRIDCTRIKNSYIPAEETGQLR